MIELKPHQLEFIDAEEQYVGLFGGIGNGKTYAACLKSIECLTNHPNNLWLIGRLTYPELRDSTREVYLSALSQIYPPEAYKINKAENSVTFWNKSTAVFRHLDNQASLLGPNLGGFLIDQAEEVDEDAFKTLQGRLRRPNVGRHKGLVVGNPQGHNWVYYTFGMDMAGGSRNWSHNTDYRMVTAPTVANASNLPANYIDQLMRSYSKEWFNRYVMGSWDAFEGQIFDLTKISGYEKLPEIRMVLTACDPAISKDKDACNTAFCTIGIGKDGHIYDLETIAGHWTFLETLERASGIVSRQKVQYLGVEDAGYQSSLTEACTRYFPNLNVMNLKADKDKFRRAKSVSHIISRGLFHTNNRELLNELSAFLPDQSGKERKDRVDALVHVLHMAQMYAPFVNEATKPEDHDLKDLNPFQQIFVRCERQEKARALGEQRVVNYDNSPANVDPDFF